ncbi:Mitogen-activated protein kinase kinase kinase 5 [Turnera subulata]|uniref:mitogen-activated protein kinase kinase kinase n=1 Tax=Turnera subulata TaxID=218843 RepID=A0A9Q0J4S8_9ROSI|nr:Mitogen-activated protein kinase kinase kinase 5 [Turnera subulata]
MRWIHNFSSMPSTSSRPSSSVKTPKTSSSSFSHGEDSAFSPLSRIGNHKNKKPGREHSRAGSLGAESKDGMGPKLTRARKLRHLSDKDVPLPAALDLPDSAPLSRSASAAMPVAVPLPLPPENSDGDQSRLSASKEKEQHRDGAGEGVSVSCATSVFPVAHEKRRVGEHSEMKASNSVRPASSNAGISKDDIRISVPVRSAPTSPFGSPVLSPQKRTSAADLFPYYQMIAKSNQVWSAPEMSAFLDIPGLPPPAFFDCSAFSTDNSPLHSPRNISPLRHPKSPTGPASPLNARRSVDVSSTRREAGGNLEVHPLPLPPGAAVPPQAAAVPVAVAKPEPTPMNCQWQKGKLIGRGTFGSVYVASNRETGALCAMKEVEMFPDDPKSAECIKQLQQEIKVLSHLKHPNIVQYYGSEIVEDRFYIYLEYVHPGSINKYIREHCGAMTESVVRSFTRHILSGLAYLHSTKTIHRDIKGANLLVDAAGVVKLADFGMAKHLTGQAADLSLKGSPYWMAPELMQAVMQKDSSSDLALAVDIWSLGCTIIEMFTGKPPWSEYEGAAAMFKVMRDSPSIPEILSAEGQDFLRCCFRRNPAERPSASMLLEHRWLKNSQQLDSSSSSPSVGGIKCTDISYSPRLSDVKLDQLSGFPSQLSKKGKAASERSSILHHSFSPRRLASDLMKLPT